jgi:hypothetical protein
VRSNEVAFAILRNESASTMKGLREALAERIAFERWTEERDYLLSNGKVVLPDDGVSAVEMALVWGEIFRFERLG